MKICVDENIPADTVAALRSLGHDVLDIRGTVDEGMDDIDLWRMIQPTNRLLITTDKGFAQYRGDSHSGILIIRLRQPTGQKIHDRVMRAIDQFSDDEWTRLLVIIRDVAQSVWRAA